MILRMTLGSAARVEVAAGDPLAAARHRPQAVKRRVGGHDGAVDERLQPEVRERVRRRRPAPPASRPRTGAVRSASSSGGRASAHSVEGTSSMPPSSPASGRRRSSTRAVLAQRHERQRQAQRPLRLGGTHRQQRRDALGPRGAPGRRRGTRGRTAASACRWWRRGPSGPGRGRRRAAPASALRQAPQLRLRRGQRRLRRANRRATTRSMLPSTGVAGAPKAMAAMAAAV